MHLGYYVPVTNMPQTTRLYQSVVQWWEAIEVLIITGAANANVEAANTAIKQIKPTARRFRNSANYRSRILLTSAPRTVA